MGKRVDISQVKNRSQNSGDVSSLHYCSYLKPWKRCFLQTLQYCQVMKVLRTCTIIVHDNSKVLGMLYNVCRLNLLPGTPRPSFLPSLPLFSPLSPLSLHSSLPPSSLPSFSPPSPLSPSFLPSFFSPSPFHPYIITMNIQSYGDFVDQYSELCTPHKPE